MSLRLETELIKLVKTLIVTAEAATRYLDRK